jgi:hypothetical protein
MINPAKRIILQGLNKAGYRLLKREEYERLLAGYGHLSDKLRYI